MSSGLVYVLDDDTDLAGSVARVLRRHGFTAEAFVDVDALFATYPRQPADCIVADVMMPRMSGFEFAAALRERAGAAPIVFMTGWPKIDDAVQAIRDHGGYDYVTKPLDESRLLRAVTLAVERSRSRQRARERLASLSLRERQVFDLLVRGYTNKEAAAELNLSVRTVEDHRASIVRKTGSKGLAELIELARE